METPERAQLSEEIADCVRALAHATTTASAPAWQRLDLSIGQLKAMMVMMVRAPLTIGALGQALGVHLSAASHIADRLVQLGFVERYEDAEDRRRTFVRLSPAGHALVTQLRQGRHEHMLAWLSVLEDEDLAALHRGLRALAKAIARGAHTDPCPRHLEHGHAEGRVFE